MQLAAFVKLARRHSIKCAAILAPILLSSTASKAQTAPPAESPLPPWVQELQRNPELVAALGKLVMRFQHDLQFPPARNESRLMPLVPESTIYFSAFPNYGHLAHQTVEILQQERDASSALRTWWLHGPLATVGPKLEESLGKFYQLSQYLGEEMVFSVALKDSEPAVVFVAEVRKQGLRDFLQRTLIELAGQTPPRVRILDRQDLAAAGGDSSPDLLVLVRPDFVVAAPDLATLRSFSAQLDRNGGEFASTPFGQRVRHAYEDGVTVLAAADLQKILAQVPRGANPAQIAFQDSGFADMKYLVWDHKRIASEAVSELELSFTGPRKGIASWLAAPGPMASLDFVSPRAIIVAAALLKNPAEIFADVRETATASDPKAFAPLESAEHALNFSLKDDVDRQLQGEITFELDNLTPPIDEKKQATPVSFHTSEQIHEAPPPVTPSWKAILRVNDADHLQKTFATLLSEVQMVAEPHDNGGITSYTLHMPAKANPEITYAFVEGYLVIASSRELLADAIRFRKTGESLAKSRKLMASLPSGHPAGPSALLFEDPIAAAALQLRRLAPEMSGPMAQLAGQQPPVVLCVYGDETSIREASTNMAFDAGLVLVAAAIAIPNLLRSRIAANEASAVGTVRTLDTAQITYESTYEEKGFAPDLATLGPDPSGKVVYTPAHAGLIDSALGGSTCTAGVWCTKSGYRFLISAVCKQHKCEDYVVIATPVSDATGARNFCSTSDGIVRFQAAPPLDAPITVAACRAWPPIQ